MDWNEENSSDFRNGSRIPILGRIAAGLPLLAEENIEGYVLADGLPNSAQYFALRVVGDSMNAAHVPNGSIAVIRQQSQVNNGEIAVVVVDGMDGTLKVFRRDGDTVFLLPRSTNPEHTPQIYNLRDVKVDVLGKLAQVVINEEYLV
jgi:repressor LexA